MENYNEFSKFVIGKSDIQIIAMHRDVKEWYQRGYLTAKEYSDYLQILYTILDILVN